MYAGGPVSRDTAGEMMTPLHSPYQIDWLSGQLEDCATGNITSHHV